MADAPVTSGVGGDLAARFGGGKSVHTQTVAASGDTTVLTPASGKRLAVYWIAAIPDPNNETTPLIIVKWSVSGDELYRSYAVVHWEELIGATDEPLVVNLSAAVSTPVTIHYREIT